MKIFIAIGNSNLEEIIRTGPYEVVDSEDNLSSLYDLLEFVEVEGLVINRLLGDTKELEKVAARATKKGIKVVILVRGFKDYEERKLITNLVNIGVTGFIELEKISGDSIEKILSDYPKEFDFGLFSETRIEYRDIVKSVFKQVFTVYSPASQGATTFAVHLGAALARKSNSSVCILDYNIFKPWVAKVMDTRAEYGLEHALDAVTKNSLTTEMLQSIVKQSKNIKNLNYMSGITDLNDFYTSTLEQYEEIIRKLQFAFDYLIIDTNSYYDLLPSDAALRLADKIIMPVRADKFSIDHFNSRVEMFTKYDDFDIKKFKAVFTLYSDNDLTSIEAESSLEAPCLGFISYHKDYITKSNVFSNVKLMKEYSKILGKLDIKLADSGSSLNLARIFARR